MEKRNTIIRDLTTGSVPRTLLSFSLPLFLSGLLQMVYNLVDMIIVGNFVGTNGLSAVSIGGEVLMLITFVAMGFSNAGQILISRYVGEQRKDLIGEMVGTLFTLLMSLALVILAVFLLIYQDIIRWLNTPPEIWEYTRQYCITCVLGVVFIYGYNLVSAIMRGMGDSRHPFQFIAIASAVNVVLDLLFVGPLGMGPLGAALATVIGQAVSFLFALALGNSRKYWLFPLIAGCANVLNYMCNSMMTFKLVPDSGTLWVFGLAFAGACAGILLSRIANFLDRGSRKG